MKLTWSPATGEIGSPVVLADDSIGRGDGSMRLLSLVPGFRRVAQLAAYPRAEAVETFDRGNLVSTVSAIVAYEFGSVGESARYLLRLGALLSGKGTLRIDHDDGGSDRLPDAVWETMEPSPQIGVSCNVRFTFVGGALDIPKT